MVYRLFSWPLLINRVLVCSVSVTTLYSLPPVEELNYRTDNSDVANYNPGKLQSWRVEVIQSSKLFALINFYRILLSI